LKGIFSSTPSSNSGGNEIIDVAVSVLAAMIKECCSWYG
jgi:hypothetical protein